MKRFTGLLNRTKSSSSGDFLNSDNAAPDSPQANAARAIRLFCESGPTANRDEEVLHLPVIVEAAESSPAAAHAAAQQIKRFLTKDYTSKPYVQYNAIMLIRILVDNPGPTFTRCFDESFVKIVKELLKGCKDKSTQQILRETLDFLEVNKGYDEGLQGLIAMWRKQKGAQGSLSHAGSTRRAPGGSQRGSGQMGAGMPPPMMQPQPNDQRVFQRHQLPPAHELASRIEEARNTAKILLQLIQSTPPEEILSNELVREFSERCQSAQKSMQTYINCDSPAPDDDTMLTLIETNEQLSLASSRYQRAVLSARRAMGASTSPNPEALNDGYGAFSSPIAPGQTESLFASQPPLRQPTNGYVPPPMPLPQLQQQPQQRQQHYHPHDDDDDDEDLYQASPNPPPQRPYQPTPPGSQQQGPQTSNPFLDPAPLAIEPTNYGPSPVPRKPLNPSTNQTSNSNQTPTHTRTPSFPSPVSPPPTRPYHQTGPTPSYMNRQASASNGLTMHGATSDDNVAEIDGHSTVGRSGGGEVSPLEARFGGQRPGEREGVARRVSRVDVLGTGGLRGA